MDVFSSLLFLRKKTFSVIVLRVHLSFQKDRCFMRMLFKKKRHNISSNPLAELKREKKAHAGFEMIMGKLWRKRLEGRDEEEL